MTIAYLMKNTLLALDLQQQAAQQERTACLSPC
jgi:methylenetetrahydrofolate dehydrogenase (NADP+)/methenyltetrahydrofolate cyclohydrolase